MEEEKKEIKVPIKSMIEQEVYRNGCKYEEDEFNILRKYFIACLNLGYIVPSNLAVMVNKFCTKIKYIVTNYNSINKLDYYVINNGVLYISGALKESNIDFYEINLYKAVSEVIFNANDEHIGISNAICEMVAEKIYNMDTNETRIILPKTNLEVIDGKHHKLRSGYVNYDLIITLLKQLFICKQINENPTIKAMFNSDYNTVINDLFKSEDDKLILTVLDKICLMYITRKSKGIIDHSENELINKYQIIVNSMFKEINQFYYAFCALITTDELRDKCMMTLQDK